MHFVLASETKIKYRCRKTRILRPRQKSCIGNRHELEREGGERKSKKGRDKELVPERERGRTRTREGERERKRKKETDKEKERESEKERDQDKE